MRKRKNSLINTKIIIRVLGILLFVETAMFLLCALVSWFYEEKETLTFLQTAAINTAVGIVLILLSRGAERKLTKRDGYCIASLSWVLFSAFGMLPFYLSGSVDSITNAFFETMSGFTTTGATMSVSPLPSCPFSMKGTCNFFQPKQQGSPTTNCIPKSASWSNGSGGYTSC